jgi:aminoglycoside 6'-N-acetyltransferase
LAYGVAMELRGERVVLRPLRAEDARRLAELASHPDVARWWPGLDEAELLEKAEGKPGEGFFAVLHDGALIGLVQYAEELDPEYRHAGIDLFLGAPYHGRGLGTDAVRTIAGHLVRDRGHHRLTIDPIAHNVRAIRSYERVGFRRVGIMREYQRDPDGTWRDGLLLDLLERELDDEL